MKFELGQLLQLEYKVSLIEKFPTGYHQGTYNHELVKDDFVIFLGDKRRRYNDMYFYVLCAFGSGWIYVGAVNRGGNWAW